MNNNSTEPGDHDHRILRFRPRAGTSGSAQDWRTQRDRRANAPPVENLAKYEGGERDDDYRHRMMVNLAALVFTLVLAAAGAWLAVKIADMRKNQDCVLSGRRNCAPIAVQPPERS